MLRFDLKKDALKFVDTLPPKQFKQIVTKLFALAANPTPGDSIVLKGFPYHRVSVGEYRIVYQFDDACLYIILIGKRNDDDVYKAVKRK